MNRPSETLIKQAVNTTGGFRPAARFLREQGFDISESGIRGMMKRWEDDDTDFELETPISSEIDIDALIARRIEQFSIKKQIREREQILPVRVKLDGPIGLGFMGDPHIDDDGTDIQQLFDHVDLFGKHNEGLFACNLGDVSNNWIGKLSHLWSEQSTSAAESRALVNEFLGRTNWLFYIHGNHDCLDEATELLTQRGWINHTDIRSTDVVLGLNPETNEAEWQPIQAVIRKQGTELKQLNGLRMDLSCTENHRILHAVYPNKGGKLQYKTASELSGKNFSIPVAAPVSTPGSSLSDDEIRLSAWLVTDSHKTEDGYYILYQSKPEMVSQIELLLYKSNIEYTHFVRVRAPEEIKGRIVKSALPAHEFHILAASTDYIKSLAPCTSRLPAWVFEMDDRQFSIFLNEYIAADGSWYSGGGRNGAIVYGEKTILEDLQILCLTRGVSANISQDNRGSWRLNVCFKRFSSFNKTTGVFKTVPYSGAVWCLSVPLTNFMIRRNGKPHFTGNCWGGGNNLLTQILAQNAAITKEHRVRVGLRLPNGRNVKIHAAHGFRGKSMWSEVYGAARVAQLDGDHHDIYAGGHIHTSGYAHGMRPSSGRMWHAIQVASYKKFDRYADELGLDSKDLYNCPVALIDPNATSDINFIRWEFDPHEGAERLRWMRNRWNAGKSAS